MGKMRLVALLLCFAVSNSVVWAQAPSRPLILDDDPALDPSLPPRIAVRKLQIGRAASLEGLRRIELGANRRATPEPIRRDVPDVARGTLEFAHDERIPVLDNETLGPFDVLPVDFDGDGDKDLIQVIDRGVALIARNESTYGPPVAQELGGFPVQIGSVDVDGDGNEDVVALMRSSGALVVLEYAEGRLAEAMRLIETDLPGSFQFFDADLDGDLDLAIGHDEANAVAIYRNAAGAYEAVARYVIGSIDGSPHTSLNLQSGDMNGDGLPDIVGLDTRDRYIVVLPGLGDCTFGAPISSATAPRAYNLALADLDGDLDLDVAFSDWVVTVMANDGSGHFVRTMSLGPGLGWYLGIGTADLDGDGDPELLTCDRASWGSDRDRVVVYETPLGGTVHRYLVERSPYDVQFGDMNGDGLPEVLTSNIDDRNGRPRSLSIVHNRGRGLLESTNEFDLPGGEAVPGSADYVARIHAIEIDGAPSLIFSRGSTVQLMRGNGRGWFSPPENLFHGRVVATADFNGDGLDDVVINVPPVHEVRLGDGRGRFDPASRIRSGWVPADVDGDGLLDLVYSDGRGGFSVRLNAGDGGFADEKSLGQAPSARNLGVLKFVELDGLKGDELVLAFDGPALEDTLEIWTNDRRRGFRDPVRVVGPGGPSRWPFSNERPFQIETADFNADGMADFVVLGVSGYGPSYVCVFLANSDGSWTPKLAPYWSSETIAMVVEDFDLDGYPDVAVVDIRSEDPGRVGFLKGQGNGELEFDELRVPGNYPIGVAKADFDGDGLMDLALTCVREGTIGVLYNVSTPPSPREIAAVVESAAIENGTASVVWSAPGVTRVQVQRATRGRHWETFGTPAWLASGLLSVEDASVEPVNRVGYRLVSLEPGVAIVGSEAWVKTGPERGVRVSGVLNASVGDGSGVGLGIEAAEPGDAVIELFDVSGRRVSGRQVVRLEAGKQRVGVRVGTEVEPGVLFVRVTRGAEVVVVRVVVVR